MITAVFRCGSFLLKDIEIQNKCESVLFKDCKVYVCTVLSLWVYRHFTLSNLKL